MSHHKKWIHGFEFANPPKHLIYDLIYNTVAFNGHRWTPTQPEEMYEGSKS